MRIADRIVIETLRHEHHSLQYIANYLGFSKTSIFNELHRLPGSYQAKLTQLGNEAKLKLRGRKLTLTSNLQRLIEEKLKLLSGRGR